MTLTPEQLDELERKAKALIDAPVAFHATESGSEDERSAERTWRLAAEAFRHATPPARIIHLVAVYRAALAWRETLGRPRGDRLADDAERALLAALRGTP